MNIRKMIAREGVLLFLVVLIAWTISHIDIYQQLIYKSGLCGVSVNEGVKLAKLASGNFDLEVRLRTEVVQHKVLVYGFILIFLAYSIFRFVTWAYRNLKSKG